MKIVEEKELNKSRDEIVSMAYGVCKSALFPVDESDVYDHIYGDSNLTTRFLLNKSNEIVGFGVVQNYDIDIEDVSLAFSYLQGMVIAKKYQGYGYSKEMLSRLYECFQSELFGLRTQNPKMASALLNLFPNILNRVPIKDGDYIYNAKELLDLIRLLPPYEMMNDNGIVKNCYQNQLYPNLEELKSVYNNINLDATDALAVVVQPKKILSKKFKKCKEC